MGTSIGFGGGEVIEVSLPLEEVQRLVEQALADRALLEFEAPNGEVIVLNPHQIKVLQNGGAT